MAALEAAIRGISTADSRPAMEHVLSLKLGVNRPAHSPAAGPRPAAQGRVLGRTLVLADGTIRHPPRHSSRDGEHDSDGFYLQAGPGIAPGSGGPELGIEHLALHLCAAAGIDLDVAKP